MVTEIVVSVKRGTKTTATMLTFDRLDAAALAQVEDAAHDLTSFAERLAREDASKETQP